MNDEIMKELMKEEGVSTIEDLYKKFGELRENDATLNDYILNKEEDEKLNREIEKRLKEEGVLKEPLLEKEVDFEAIMKKRPHVVLLGAGASVAAIPNGDRNKMRTSVMKGFIDKLEMREVIDNIDLTFESDNLEDIYSALTESTEFDNVRIELEERIYNYFSKFQIPDEPTVYDYLILSLTKKDLIATFNWDPLLFQAYQRCLEITDNLPELAFLHGNVSIGICNSHKVGGYIGGYCPQCDKPFERVPLLYPVKEKNYEENLFIKDQWNVVRQYLDRAYMFTIFGYSAPKTDKSAIDLLKKAWGKKEDRNLEEIEVIDIADEGTLVASWEQFIHTHHYSIHDSFFKSTIGCFPRRSCEATFDRLMNVRFLDNTKGFKVDMKFDDIELLIKTLIDEENRNGQILTHPYLFSIEK